MSAALNVGCARFQSGLPKHQASPSKGTVAAAGSPPPHLRGLRGGGAERPLAPGLCPPGFASRPGRAEQGPGRPPAAAVVRPR